MTGSEFELILEGPVDYSPDTRARLKKALTTACGFTVVETEAALESGRHNMVICRAQDADELKVYYDALESAGGRVFIVMRPAEGRPERSRFQKKHRPADTVDVSGYISPFREFYSRYIQGINQVLEALDVSQVELLVADLCRARGAHRQILLIGNGGSAANASHIVNDLGKQRVADERCLFRVISLADNVSRITACANDLGYDQIFMNQLKNILEPGDLVIAISSSGNSPNVIKAVEYANARGAMTWGMVGFEGGGLQKAAKRCIYIPTEVGQYGFMEDVTLVIGHMISEFVTERDQELFSF